MPPFPTAPPAQALTRRSLVLCMGASSAGAAVMAAGLVRADTPSTTGSAEFDLFLTVSRNLTGFDTLDTRLGGKLHDALVQIDSGFDTKLSQLSNQLLHDAPVGPLAMVAGSDLAETCSAILRAWYLGIVGEGAKAHVFAYEHALMYAPLADVCVLPTYARGEPHYWAQPPFRQAHA